jgi:hypothetical protein
MWCWNKTCGLSNLPISEGEEVFVFVVVESPSYERENACYSNYLYTPVLTSFQSEYDDYGGGENSKGVALPIIMNAIKDHMIEKEVGENQFHDIAVKKEGFDEDRFFRAVHKDRLEISTRKRPAKVKFVMMRKSIVDKVLENWEIKEFEGYFNGKSHYKTYKFKDVIDTVDLLIGKIKNSQEKMREEEMYKDDPVCQSIKEFIWNSNSLFWFDDSSLSGEWMQILTHGFSYRNGLFDVKKVLSDMIEVEDYESAKLLIIECIRGLFMDRFMNTTRRIWVPPCGEGSQTLEYKSHRVLISAMLSEIDGAIAEMENQ